MDLQSLILFLGLGAVAGWIAGLLMRGGLVGSLITAVAGAAVLLLIVGVLKKA